MSPTSTASLNGSAGLPGRLKYLRMAAALAPKHTDATRTPAANATTTARRIATRHLPYWRAEGTTDSAGPPSPSDGARPRSAGAPRSPARPPASRPAAAAGGPAARAAGSSAPSTATARESASRPCTAPSSAPATAALVSVSPPRRTVATTPCLQARRVQQLVEGVLQRDPAPSPRSPGRRPAARGGPPRAPRAPAAPRRSPRPTPRPRATRPRRRPRRAPRGRPPPRRPPSRRRTPGSGA